MSHTHSTRPYVWIATFIQLPSTDVLPCEWTYPAGNGYIHSARPYAWITLQPSVSFTLQLSYCIRLLLGWPRVVDHTLLLHLYQRRSDGFAHRLNSLSFRLGVAPGQACYLPRRPAQRFPRQSAPRHLPFLFLLHCAVAEICALIVPCFNAQCFCCGIVNHTSRLHPARGLTNRVLGLL